MERTFLRVDGMYSITCEAFLESIAESCPGVGNAAASYITETIRITHDPAVISEEELCRDLSVLGYTASVPDPAAEDPSDRYMTPRGTPGPGTDTMLGFRYVAGVIFGSFMLLPYVIYLYPLQLSAYIDSPYFGLFGDPAGAFGPGGVLILPPFLVLTGVVLFFTGAPLLRGAYISVKIRRPNTDLLVAMTVLSAYVYSAVALLAGRIDAYFDLTIVVAAGVVAAFYYESLIKRRAAALLTDLTVSQVETATVMDEDGTTTDIPVASVESGDPILVRHGERVPVDGVLVEGECTVDEAVVTGESLPRLKEVGDELIGGSVVVDGAAVIDAGSDAQSSMARLTATVWGLQTAEHGIQRRADRVASYVIPIVGAIAVVAGVIVGGVGGITGGLLTTLLVLIVGCPWALGLATPLSVAAGIKEAMTRGIVVFDETIFERLRAIDVVVFDKTGTLTTGDMEVIETNVSEDLLAAAAALERRTAHPVADAIAATSDTVSEMSDSAHTNGGVADGFDGDPPGLVSDFQRHGTGVEGTVDGTHTVVGHLNLFKDLDWTVEDSIEAAVTRERAAGRLPVIVGQSGAADGVIVLGDRQRAGWAETVTRLVDRGIDVIVVTGDDEEATEFLKDHPGIAAVFAEVPPAGKTAAIRRLQATRRVAMVGDGTNDAPALAAADLGISLGSGTALASDAADIAIADDDLDSVPTAFDIAFASRRRIKGTTQLALVYNLVTIPLAAIGLLMPVLTMVAVVATGGLVVANSFRALLPASQ